MKNLNKKSLLVMTLLFTVSSPVLAESTVKPTTCYPILGCVPPVKIIETLNLDPAPAQAEQ